ncbi:hypothetical protein [Amycolatopsis thermoflava]|uniref:hypothetical protein n=1 Tax=Amycolatopsis thermoflava TaxID=84480 RepID=UPI0036600293
MLDERAVVGPACDAVDLFADDCLEAPVGVGCLFEQIVDTAVTRDGDGEPLVTVAPATHVEVFASGFDVVEVRDDDAALGQRFLRDAQLAQQRSDGVLLVVGGGASEKRDRDQGRCSRDRGRVEAVPAGTVRARDSTQAALLVEPFLDCLWASHCVTSISTWACSSRSRSASAPSAMRMSSRISGSAAGSGKRSFVEVIEASAIPET